MPRVMDDDMYFITRAQPSIVLVLCVPEQYLLLPHLAQLKTSGVNAWEILDVCTDFECGGVPGAGRRKARPFLHIRAVETRVLKLSR